MTLVTLQKIQRQRSLVGLAYGAKVSSDVIDGLNVWAKFVGAGDGWKGDTIKAGKQVVSAGAKYTETELEVSGDVEQTIDGDNKVNLGAKYRFSDKVGFGDLFKGDKYFNNDAPAAGLSASLTEFKLGSVTLNVASPVLEDFIWAKALVRTAI